ncbi:unnamed protein product [Acanthosepion pharaonis]|uniref:Uncharacterized protein n=1 Tax=Acanthosepion pharaonis TaxID=158019 RepID=A0A812BJY0_ACAPH|nr:unnamed protein product [Sepia pharaonis]
MRITTCISLLRIKHPRKTRKCVSPPASKYCKFRRRRGNAYHHLHLNIAKLRGRRGNAYHLHLNIASSKEDEEMRITTCISLLQAPRKTRKCVFTTCMSIFQVPRKTRKCVSPPVSRRRGMLPKTTRKCVSPPVSQYCKFRRRRGNAYHHLHLNIASSEDDEEMRHHHHAYSLLRITKYPKKTRKCVSPPLSHYCKKTRKTRTCVSPPILQAPRRRGNASKYCKLRGRRGNVHYCKFREDEEMKTTRKCVSPPVSHYCKLQRKTRKCVSPPASHYFKLPKVSDEEMRITTCISLLQAPRKTRKCVSPPASKYCKFRRRRGNAYHHLYLIIASSEEDEEMRITTCISLLQAPKKTRKCVSPPEDEEMRITTCMSIFQVPKTTRKCVSPPVSHYCKLRGRRGNAYHHLHLNIASSEDDEEMRITTCISLLQAPRKTRKCVSPPASKYCKFRRRRGNAYHQLYLIIASSEEDEEMRITTCISLLQAPKKTRKCVSPPVSHYCKLRGRRGNAYHYLHLNIARLEIDEELSVTICISILQAPRKTRKCVSPPASQFCKVGDRQGTACHHQHLNIASSEEDEKMRITTCISILQAPKNTRKCVSPPASQYCKLRRRRGNAYHHLHLIIARLKTDEELPVSISISILQATRKTKKCVSPPASQYCKLRGRRGNALEIDEELSVTICISILQAPRKTRKCVSPPASQYCKVEDRRGTACHHQHLNIASSEEDEEMRITTCISILQAPRKTRKCVSPPASQYSPPSSKGRRGKCVSPPASQYCKAGDRRGTVCHHQHLNIASTEEDEEMRITTCISLLQG